jgi:hypothetical protein
MLGGTEERSGKYIIIQEDTHEGSENGGERSLCEI